MGSGGGANVGYRLCWGDRALRDGWLFAGWPGMVVIVHTAVSGGVVVITRVKATNSDPMRSHCTRGLERGGSAEDRPSQSQSIAPRPLVQSACPLTCVGIASPRGQARAARGR
jgi:hypothetical protein